MGARGSEAIGKGDAPGAPAARHWVWLVYFFFLVVVLIPIWSVTHPPLQDYPNHLARMFLIGHADETPLRDFYEIAWRLVPNLASDLIIPVLNQVFSLEVSGKLFISLTFFLMTFSTVLLSKKIHRFATPISFAAFLFLYNFALYKGFLNFLFSCGLAFLGILAWMRMSEQPPWRRVVFGSAISLALFISHLYGFAFYALVTMIHDFLAFRKGRVRDLHALALAAWHWGAQFLFPVALFFWVSPTGSATPKGGYLLADVLQMVAHKEWLALKIANLTYLVPRYLPGLDALIYFLVAFALVVAFREQRGRSRNFMLISIGAGFVVYLFTPWLLLTSAHADWRILVPLAFLLFAAIPWPRTGKWIEAGTLMVIGAVVMAQSAVVTSQWQKGERLYENYQTIAAHLPIGARLFSYSNTLIYQRLVYPVPILHMASFAVIDRKVFLPSMFAFESQQVLSYSEAYRDLAWQHRHIYYGAVAPNWTQIEQNYDFVLNIYDLSQEDMSRMPEGWEVEAAAGPFTLLKPLKR